MTAYYNEFNPDNVVWLKGLVDAGLIAYGVVDERSIEDVRPSDLKGFKQCHFFAGIGVWSYALRRAGISDDTHVWTGSCPCQPFSTAGKRGGMADERHLWPAFHHLIEQCKPDVVFGEQVASKDGLAWLDLVQADLEGSGYTNGAVDTCAAGFGADHVRQRLYWFADTEGVRWERPKHEGRDTKRDEERRPLPSHDTSLSWIALVGGVLGVCERNGITCAMERRLLHGYGNALFAPQAQAFIEAYREMRNDTNLARQGLR